MPQHFTIYSYPEFDDYGFDISTDYAYTEYVPPKSMGLFGWHTRSAYDFLKRYCPKKLW